MSKYIDTDSLDAVVQKLNTDGWNITRGDYKKIDRVLFEFPSADVRPNVHGKWVKDEGGFDIRDNFYHCSKCGRVINIICGDTLENYPFCHCGADMRKGETNGFNQETRCD